jgi:hypothetical protein
LTFSAERQQSVPGETLQQTFAAAIHLLATQFDAIADDINKGNIADEAEAQRRVYAVRTDLRARFRDFGCNTNPR